VRNPAGRRSLLQILLLVGFAVFVAASVLTPKGPTPLSTAADASAVAPGVEAGHLTGAAANGYESASGRLWTGVKLYYGPAKMYVGEVLGGTSRYPDLDGGTMRAIKVRMCGGSEEWKNREAVIAGSWYVRSDDPALARQEWRDYTF
jgi:hypothetical protein